MAATTPSTVAGTSSAGFGAWGAEGRRPPRFVDVVGIIASLAQWGQLDVKAVRLTCREALLAHTATLSSVRVMADKLPIGQDGAAELVRFCRRSFPKGGPHTLRVTTTSAKAEVPEDHL